VEAFAVTLAPEPALLQEFRHRLTRWLEKAAVSRQDRDAILLAAHEAAANGIEHAAREGPVTVLGRIEPDAILIEVMSAGRWGEQLQEASDERGRGLMLMRRLVSEVEIVAEAERTTVRLRWIRP
jgi:anti-sigma regulatory factor (Ser/Thr protein kinase)